MGVISCGTTMINNGAFQGLAVLSWDTTVKTSNFTAVAGHGYFVNTTSGSITVTLPSSPSASDQVAIKDYAATTGANKIVVARNGSNINGAAADADILTSGESATLFYVDSTQGWSVIMDGNKEAAQDQKFITATGGTITTDGDYKVHTFTSPGTFTVTCAGSTTGSTDIDYLLIAGGGGGAAGYERGAGAGGGGGFRESPGKSSGYNGYGNLDSFTVAATGYPVTVGAGGSGGTNPNTGNPSCNGSASTFLGFSAAGGGGSLAGPPQPTSSPAGQNGGSGGGGSGIDCAPGRIAGQPYPVKNTGGLGNVPSFALVQGFPGGNSPGERSGNPAVYRNSGGGGGASQRGYDAGAALPGGGGRGGRGGDGRASTISGTGTYYGGGGGGLVNACGGLGGGGKSLPLTQAGGTNGTANTGGGGSGGLTSGGNGGSGLVVIRYKFQ